MKRTSKDTIAKPWYKRWWGIIIVVLIWPLFFGWVVWRRTKWPMAAKVGASVALAIGCFCMSAVYAGILTGGSQSNRTATTTSAHTTTSTKQKAAPPKITTADVTETQPIPFKTTARDDNTLPKGQTKVITPGKDGVSTSVYKVTYTNGKETGRELESETTTTPPVDEVDAIGTYVAPLLDISGSGTRQTQKFTASGDWSITYTFDCSGFGMQGNFQIYIFNGDGSLDFADGGANDLAMNGGTTDYYYDSGTHYLEINSECSWHVTVNG